MRLQGMGPLTIEPCNDSLKVQTNNIELATELRVPVIAMYPSVMMWPTSSAAWYRLSCPPCGENVAPIVYA
jgi:hypothetical protein